MESPALAKSVVVHVEACLRPTSVVSVTDVKLAVASYIEAHYQFVSDGDIELKDDGANIAEIVSYVRVCDLADAVGHTNPLPFWQCDLRVHVFTLNDDGVSMEMTDDKADDEEIPAYQQWCLPAVEFEGLWDSLIYEQGLKTRLTEYAATAMLFSDKQVDTNLISWNRIVLLHGPPGTGKTSLGKALAQKLSIRLDRYKYSQLVEINAHSLFSKWFSESGKLVMKLFGRIQELADDEDTFVTVLIDEVESLTSARKSAMSGSEPSDAIRVVNAVLTQIDQLKARHNVLIITTSNVTGAIDLAFVDRADVKQFIGNPTIPARYQILRSCVQELMRVGIVEKGCLEPHWDKANEKGDALAATSEQCEGCSGRALRKLPFLAHSSYVQEPACTLAKYLSALRQAASAESSARQALNNF